MSADDDALLAELLGQGSGSIIDRLDRALAQAWKLSTGLTIDIPQSGGDPGPYHPGADSITLAADQVTSRWGTSPKARTMSEKATLLTALVSGIAAARSTPTPDPGTGGGGGAGGTGAWKTLPVMTSSAATGERSSFQSAVPSWGPDGMTVSLLARGDKGGTPNPTAGGGTQRCEIHLAGWENLTGTLFLRYDFTLAPGFPTATNDWQAVMQCKNSSTGSPPLELMIGKGGKVYLQWHSKGGAETGTEFLGAATTGVRHSVILKVPFTSSSNAPVSGWMDGKAAFTDKSHGPTLYSGQSSYGKLGLYRSNAIGVAATITHHAVAKGGTFEEVAGSGKADGSNPAPGTDPTPAPAPTPKPNEPDQPYRKTCEVPYGSFPTGNTGWITTQGRWGASTAQCIETVGARGFRVVRSDHNKNGVAAYPSVWAGGAWADGSGAKGWKSTKVRDLPNLTTSAKFAAPTSSWRGNMAWDIWFDRDPTKCNGLEMMLWGWREGVDPAGSKVSALSAGGATWDVWRGTVGGVPVLSYVRQQNTLTIDRLPLKPFMDDATSRGLLGPDWFCTSPQIGSELWRGGAGFALLDWSFA